jgi:hypothetical protein
MDGAAHWQMDLWLQEKLQASRGCRQSVLCCAVPACSTSALAALRGQGIVMVKAARGYTNP